MIHYNILSIISYCNDLLLLLRWQTTTATVPPSASAAPAKLLRVSVLQYVIGESPTRR